MHQLSHSPAPGTITLCHVRKPDGGAGIALLLGTRAGVDDRGMAHVLAVPGTPCLGGPGSGSCVRFEPAPGSGLDMPTRFDLAQADWLRLTRSRFPGLGKANGALGRVQGPAWRHLVEACQHRRKCNPGFDTALQQLRTDPAPRPQPASPRPPLACSPTRPGAADSRRRRHAPRAVPVERRWPPMRAWRPGLRNRRRGLLRLP